MNIIRVTRPTLTAEERARRYEEIKRATARLITETEQQKRRNNGKHHQGL